MPETARRTTAARLNTVFHALSDGRRRAMIERLAESDLSVKEIAAPLRMALPSALKHLYVLEDARLVRSVKKGRVRMYRLSKRAFDDIEAWVTLRKRAVNRQFDRLDAFLARSAGTNEE
jgi:DNA-binding transcriptional ArsR family regulator